MKLDDFVFDKNKQALVDEFLSNNHITKYILGRNECAEKLSALVDVDAYIDDFTDEKAYLGKPIIRSSDVSLNAIAVSCSLALFPHSAMNILSKTGVEKVIHYLDILNYAQKNVLGMAFLEAARLDIKVNYDRYNHLYESLSDTISKKILTDLLNFRKTHELSYLKHYKVDFIGQYFEDFLSLAKGEVFIDAGGYDGNTSVEFIKHCPEYKSIYIFEPSDTNLQKAKMNLKSFSNIHFIAKGLSDKKGHLSFDPSAGSACSILEQGSVQIMVDTLDDLVNERVTFIKMDIEGSEGLAIDGMSQHILNDHPKLAISVYHKPKDLWMIPEQILNIRNDYAIYLRHYTEGTDETVMFFMPVVDPINHKSTNMNILIGSNDGLSKST